MIFIGKVAVDSVWFLGHDRVEVYRFLDLWETFEVDEAFVHCGYYADIEQAFVTFSHVSLLVRVECWLAEGPGALDPGFLFVAVGVSAIVVDDDLKVRTGANLFETSEAYLLLELQEVLKVQGFTLL
eukprot:TRINITY_DN9814_c0_g1_i1.p4 TRINITY_DN9814_c0_g1~~TRINITY_DN9814_c0_g1_i1.p4  ORF type:complete len:127 (-),score=12.77 TRINITY_DN9814_c0_g1_i1:4450-4830(-)